MLEIKNTVVIMVVFIFLKDNGLCGRLAGSSYFCTEESILCMNVCACVMLSACTLHARL